MKKLSVESMGIEINLDNGITSVIGNSNSGKTYFLKKLINKINNDDISIDNIPIKEFDYSFLVNNIFVSFDDDSFKCEYVAEELFYYLNVLGYSLSDITKKINEIVKFFGLKELENKRIESLHVSKRILVKILSMLIVRPKILALDNLFPYLTNEQIELIIKYVKKHNITLINVINDGRYLKYSDYVIVLNEGKTIFNGSVKELLSGNSIIPYIGIKLPFVFELSSNLMLYGLINKLYYDESRLVNDLWK